MTISETNIVRRWELMASKDLGIDRNVEADGFYKLFKSIFEYDNTQPTGTEYINPIIRGFAYNNPDLEINVVECLGLNHVDITKEAAQQLDWYLMNRLGWFERYQFSQTI